ncbi:Golgin subfamily A member 5 [Oryzias melastigma]|uniref:Golgin subfamily A member 5 n=1 Tax=Oryzias melastigma TaxID=30732 RepID=A0A834CAJ8_ORYME|nr:Golgin subfamily A member 5 [Oryzias melastigma]
MSWFTDLAGKAEDFLNKVDQGAATALSTSQTRTSFSSAYEQESAVRDEFISTAAVKADAQSSSHDASSFIAAAAGNIKRSSATLLAGTANVPSNAANSGTSSSNSIKSSSSFVRPKKSEQDVNDDMLFDFLNSSDPPEISRRDSRKDLAKLAAPISEPQNPTPPPPSTSVQATFSAPSTPPSTRGVSRASSMSSLSAHSIRTSEEQTQDTPEGSDSSLALLQDPSKHGTPPPPAEEPPSQVLSSLRLENQLLRSEVASLNQEMASVIQRAKDLQEGEVKQAAAATHSQPSPLSELTPLCPPPPQS